MTQPITAARLLSATGPEEIFSGPGNVEIEYRVLAKKYHPDLNRGDLRAEEVFKQLGVLHTRAKEKIKIGEWIIPGQIDLISTDGNKFRLHYVKEFTNGIATGYIGKSTVVYVIDNEYDDLVQGALQTIQSFSFPSDAVKKEMAFYLPVVKKTFKTKDRTVIVFEKPEDLIRLRDVVDHYDGKLNPKHAAWITSRMSNFCCWLQHGNKITHNDLSMDTIFICPEHHTAMVIGGWWHSAKIGARMQRRQTGRTIAVLPSTVRDTKQAAITTDLALVRLLGREMLGDATGMSFIKDTSIPAPFSAWIREAPIGDPVKDFARWEEVVVKSFGARRFTKMELKHSDVYKEK
jgi:hypothetical protein